VDAQRAASPAQPDPVEVGAEYIGEPTTPDWSPGPEEDPGLSATEIYNGLMVLGRIAETMGESVNLGNDLHQVFVGIQQRVGEVLGDSFDDGFDPAATGWMGCSSELPKQRIRAIKKLMTKRSK
jgi:hypothetical protein